MMPVPFARSKRRGTSHRPWLAIGAGIMGVVSSLSCQVNHQAELERIIAAWQHVSPPRPTSCQSVAPGHSLQDIIDLAPDGTVLCLEPGVHRGPVRLGRGMTLWGTREAIIKSQGVGTTVRVEGPSTKLLGLTVDGSGTRFDTSDAAVLATGENVLVEGVTVRNATFGILSEKAKSPIIRGNDVVGSDGTSLGLRGDSIRLWETRGGRVEGNRVVNGRDAVVWYSSDCVVENNLFARSRYGTHLMYSHHNVLRGNRYLSNTVGVFIMYSRHVELAHNVIAGSAGSAGMGIGMKESGNLEVHDNVLVHNTKGMAIETSPMQDTDTVTIERNEIRLAATAIGFHGTPHRLTFRDNLLADNSEQVTLDGGHDAMDTSWTQNFFDDYQGYDLDGDGFGDVPHVFRSLSSDFISKRANVAYFRGTVALGVVDVVGRAFPILDTKTLLVDRRPRMQRQKVLAHAN